jgi:hypothetical protein
MQSFIRFVCLGVVVLILSAGAVAATYYVDDDGPNDPGPFDPNVSDPLMDGSVDHPFDRIQEGIDAAIHGDTVMVQPGYYQYAGNIHFNGKNIILTSTVPDDPDIVATTIIDGGHNGSVVTFSGSETADCILQGFTITNGNAAGSYPDNCGGGVCGNSTNAMISNCIIAYNTVTNDYAQGGGLYDCDGSISNCTIAYNSNAGDYRGGGGLAHCDGPISNSTIAYNSVTGDYGGGGGLYQCHGTIYNCKITHNTIMGYDSEGGGLCACSGSITNCIISDNTARGHYSEGGGLYGCSGTISNCIISDNISEDNGGGLLYCDGIIINCTIVGNIAEVKGGGLYYCDGLIANCIIWGNMASDNDQLYLGSIPTYSCIKDWTGGGISNISIDPMLVDISSSDPSVWNLRLLPGSPCIDTGTNLPPGGLPATDIENASRPLDGDNDSNSVADMGAYEFYLDPDLPNLIATPHLISFLALGDGSDSNDQTLTIFNAGSGTMNWSIDVTGIPNWLSLAPTHGSLEYGQNDDITLSVDTSGLIDGLYSCEIDVIDPAAINSPQTITIHLCVGYTTVPGRYSKIQSAIDAVVDGFKVIVSPGTYYENINFNGKNIILTSTDPEDPNATVIDGHKNGSVVTFSGSETSTCVLRGFMITNGAAEYGGGILGNSTHASIEYCKIVNNVANHYGGGLSGCDGTISYCTIIGNGANIAPVGCGDLGGGGGLSGCSGTITNCVISNNWVASFNDADGCWIDGYGGGLYACNGTITNCRVINNEVTGNDSYGGGLAYCDGTITNSIIKGNKCTRLGGGLFRCDATIVNGIICDNDTHGIVGNAGGLCRCEGLISNCTIVGNSGRSTGGLEGQHVTSTITNCIIWGNSAAQLTSSSTPTYSCIQG